MNGRKAKGVSKNLDGLRDLGEYAYGKKNSGGGGDGGENERQFNSQSTDEYDEGSDTEQYQL